MNVEQSLEILNVNFWSDLISWTETSLLTTGLCPKTLHFDLVIPLPEGDSIQVLPAVSFFKRKRYWLSYRCWTILTKCLEALCSWRTFNRDSGWIQVRCRSQRDLLHDLGVPRQGRVLQRKLCFWVRSDYKNGPPYFFCSYCTKSFGVCCIFIVTASQTVITQNCTYIQNENFPAAQPNTNAVQYTVQKCADGTCFF